MITRFREERTAFDEGSEVEVSGIDAVCIDLFNNSREVLDSEFKRMRGGLFSSIEEILATTHDVQFRQAFREIVRLKTSEAWRNIQKGQTRAFRRERNALGASPDVTFTRKKPERETEQAA